MGNVLKKSGYTLIEVVLFMTLVTVFLYSGSVFLKVGKEKDSLNNAKVKIAVFIRKIQKYSFYNNKEYTLKIKFSENKMVFQESSGEEIETVELPANLGYISNNSDKNADFTRKTTINGNFEKGFSIFLLNSKKEKIYYKIVVNTVNSMRYPVISIFKARKAIPVAGDYMNSNLWIEEL